MLETLFIHLILAPLIFQLIKLFFASKKLTLVLLSLSLEIGYLSLEL